jgi:hypothetical protein
VFAVLAAGVLLILVVADVPAIRVWVAVAALLMLTAGLPSARPHNGALDWLVPAGLRAAEYLFVTASGMAAGVPQPLIFVLILLLALRHYDLTVRPPGGVRWPDLGWDGRVTVLAIGVGVGASSQVAAALARYLGVAFAIGALTGWGSGSAPRVLAGATVAAGPRDLAGKHVSQQPRKV